MAESIKLYAVESAGATFHFPDAVNYNKDTYGISYDYRRQSGPYASSGFDSFVLFKLEAVPDYAKAFTIKNGNLFIYLTDGYYRDYSAIFALSVDKLPEDYSLKDVTFNNSQQVIDHNFIGIGNIGSAPGFTNIEIIGTDNACQLVKNGGSVILAAGPPQNEYTYWWYATVVFGPSQPNRPYFVGELESPAITARLYPNSGFLDDKKDIIFSWDWETNALGGPEVFSQGNATLSWRNGEDGVITDINIDASDLSYTVPAGTFPETETLQVMVSVNFSDGNTAASEWSTFTTVDATPSVEIIYPKSIYIDGSIANEFKWDYIISTGASQYGATLQYSDNNGNSWKDLGEVDGSNTFYSVPADALPAGTILWRVQATNSDGILSAWSDTATIVVRNSPPQPVVTVNGDTPRPTVEWQASDQQAFQIKAGDYDSGEIYGANKNFKIPVYLPDGSVQIRVRIQNSFGLWSDWASTIVLIKNRSIGNIHLQATAMKYNVRVSWETYGITVSTVYYIYRDGDLIGKTTDTKFLDHLAFGKHDYQVRGAIGDYYSLSNIASAKLTIKTACIAEYGVWGWLDLPIRRGGMPTLSTQYGSNIVYQHFAGRELPVAEIGDDLDVAWSFSFSALEREVAEKMRRFFRRLVVYKDPRDGVCIGVLGGQQMTSDRYSWDLTYTIQAVDHQEVIEYDI